jgi:hypothetical protein
MPKFATSGRAGWIYSNESRPRNKNRLPFRKRALAASAGASIDAKFDRHLGPIGQRVVVAYPPAIREGRDGCNLRLDHRDDFLGLLARPFGGVAALHLDFAVPRIGQDQGFAHIEEKFAVAFVNN